MSFAAFSTVANIDNNAGLRAPQREGVDALRRHFQDLSSRREVALVLPVGCGKSGLIALTPLALGASRALVIAPGKRIRGQLSGDLKASSDSNFFLRCGVLREDAKLPQTAVIETGRASIDDLKHSHFAVANIQQISGEENRWLDPLPADFFDLILVDEAHHNVATSWQQVKARFPAARIVNFSATPTRSDGQLMEGQVIYSFPVVRAIELGYVKRLRAMMLRPAELRYVDRADGREHVIGADEVRALGESEASFRRGIVMSEETLGSIVDCAMGELKRLRKETGEDRLKIIASALNQDHCIQITAAFRARGMNADYVHSAESEQKNERVFALLESHKLDVIVQARMLGEGFDHPYLAVAMVGSVFSNLSPFVQFVGRVMRVIKQNAPDHPCNQGVVVFHAGSNVAQRWEDFREFSEADQDYFARLLPPLENADFGDSTVLDRDPFSQRQPIKVIEERDVRAAELDPIGDPQNADLLRQLAERGITPNQAWQGIRRYQTDHQDVREAQRAALNERVTRATGALLKQLGINSKETSLDPQAERNNFSWTVSELHRRINEGVGRPDGDRQNFPLDTLNAALDMVPDVVTALTRELRKPSAE